MKILRLNDSNIDQILEIERASFPSPWARDMFSGEFRNPAFYCLGAAEDGFLAGFICFWVIIDEIHIGNVAVNPAYRRRGAAKKMLETVIETAKQNGITAITLEVRRGNEAAIALYAAAGFTVEGARPRYYENGEDALIMWLRNI